MNDLSRVPGFTSTGSKRPDALFGPEAGGDIPLRVTRTAGCRAWDDRGREYVDYVMGLGAVALGYGYPAVNRAAQDAIAAGVVGPLAPVQEEALAEALCIRLGMERIRFFKTGAEAVAAAVRLARATTGRDAILSCGYHGWLDWSQGAGTEGVPKPIRDLRGDLAFNDVPGARESIRALGHRLAAVVVEPVVVAEPTREWLEVLRVETTKVGAVLVFDEIKTAFRLAIGGAAERYGVRPDLMVVGKALANGFPLAAVGGLADVMGAAARTWISSTLATESVSLAAALATLRVFEEERVCAHLHRVGTALLHGLHDLERRHGDIITGVGGVAEMSFLHYASDDLSQRAARACAARGLLFKRTAYNFVSLAHDDAVITRTLAMLDDVLVEVARAR